MGIEMELADKLESLHGKHCEEWRVEKEKHDYKDGTTHFTHVRYTSNRLGEPVTVEVANHVTPDLGELLCLIHNNLPTIIAALRDRPAEIERLRAALRIFVGCAYPVAKEINPRGHDWRPEGSLDYALSEAKAALGIVDQQQMPSEGKS